MAPILLPAKPVRPAPAAPAAPAGCLSLALSLRGVVQGVGMRPFLHRLAHRHGLGGWAANTGQGVELEVEGPREAVEAFLAGLAAAPPPAARIMELIQRPLPWRGHGSFAIRESQAEPGPAQPGPDLATCPRCLAELQDPGDRRYGYAFLNCTDCGPRYTITAALPYDRPRTALAGFPLCPDCAREYRDPADRRFHAQAVACPACGPRLWLEDAGGSPLADPDPLAAALALLRAGRILALKGLGGFHLAVDASNREAVGELRRRKRRPAKPLAVMVADLAAARRVAVVSPSAAKLLASPAAPILLLSKREPSPLAPELAPGLGRLGVMLPYTPLHHLLLAGGLAALVMTSGNLSDEPLAAENQEARRRLAGLADFFLLHDRPILHRVDDSVLLPVGPAAIPLRRARGLIPWPLQLPRRCPSILALGGLQKNTFCLTRGDQAFPSPHLGDLASPEARELQAATLAHYQAFLGVTPRVVAHDLHPDYPTTRQAKAHPAPRKLGVQHHHAHILSCLAEHGGSGPVLGVALDGAGWGADGRIWGGEVLLAEPRGYTRLAHLAYVPQPGGEAAIRAPWRMALAQLRAVHGSDFPLAELPLGGWLRPGQAEGLAALLAGGLNCPPTSSAGRLFDAVAALGGLCPTVSYEGEAAARLEALADPAAGRPYDFSWEEGPWPWVIATAPTLRGVVADLLAGEPLTRVSGRFHATLAELFAEICLALQRKTGLERVALSGGVFQNATLLRGLTAGLARRGLRVLTHRQVPPNDGGLSLGQALAAAALEE